MTTCPMCKAVRRKPGRKRRCNSHEMTYAQWVKTPIGAAWAEFKDTGCTSHPELRAHLENEQRAEAHP